MPIDHTRSMASGRVSLCLECVLDWFPGKTVTWWEGHHAPFADHAGDRLERALRKQRAEALAR